MKLAWPGSAQLRSGSAFVCVCVCVCVCVNVCFEKPVGGVASLQASLGGGGGAWPYSVSTSIRDLVATRSAAQALLMHLVFTTSSTFPSTNKTSPKKMGCLVWQRGHVASVTSGCWKRTKLVKP